MNVYNFESERLFYKEIALENADQIVKWRSDPKVIQFFISTEPLTLEKHLKWFKQYQQDEHRYDYMIYLKATMESIGVVGISAIDFDQSMAELNYYIGEKLYQSKGYATEAISALMDYANKTFSIKTFWAVVHLKNIASCKLLERLKFSNCGIKGDFMIYKRIFTENVL